MERIGITKQRIVSELVKSPHGELKEFLPIGLVALKEEPEFFAHLIAWNHQKGQVRDSKVALPVISLQATIIPEEYLENSLAHLALLSPRDLVRAFRFAKDLKGKGWLMSFRRMVQEYLRQREESPARFDRVALQHKAALKFLYTLTHTKPSPRAQRILFSSLYPPGSVFEAVKGLKDMSPLEAAGVILERKIPFLIASGALGKKMKEPDLLLALIERMSPQELVNNSGMLEKAGMKALPAVRAAYEQALSRAAGSKKGVSSFKAQVAAEAIEDEAVKAKLHSLQEKQIKTLGGIEGNWLVLGDKSGSMEQAIEISRQVAATLAKVVKGEVHLVFFDTSPRRIVATGQTYEQILSGTRAISAGGWTSIGCGLRYIQEAMVEVDGIAIVSDGGENHAPNFAAVYQAYCKGLGKEIPIYLYKVKGSDPDLLSPSLEREGIEFQTFDLRSGTDYYALPNLIQTMRASRYSLVDEILETPLLSLKDVFKEVEKEKEKEEVKENA